LPRFCAKEGWRTARRNGVEGLAAIGLRKYRRSKRKEESDGESLQTSKAAANGTAPQKPELHGTIEEAADGEAEEILYPISFQQGCKRTS
jgi:hypothetical protein